MEGDDYDYFVCVSVCVGAHVFLEEKFVKELSMVLKMVSGKKLKILYFYEQ